MNYYHPSLPIGLKNRANIRPRSMKRDTASIAYLIAVVIVVFTILEAVDV